MVDESEKKDDIIPVLDSLVTEQKPVKEEKAKEIGIPKEVKDHSEKEPPENAEKRPEKVSLKQWFENLGWSESPFTFAITPYLFVGYESQINKVLNILEERHKIALIVGPTGAGKTTFLKWVSGHLPDGLSCIYLGKPPQNPDDFVEIFNERFKPNWFLRLFMPNIKNLYQIPDFLNKKLKNKHLVVLFDEAHEADADVLEWLRVLSDQVENMSVLASGLPVFDEKLSNLETFRKRIIAKIELLSLTKEETRDMIKKRIENVGGKGIMPFDESIIEAIYDRTGGFPREIIKLCDDLVNRAAELGKSTISSDLLMLDIREKPREVSLDLLDKITPMQKDVIELLSKKACSPGEIANMLNLDKYKSRQHAVRSVNNILKRLMADGFVERKKLDRAFLYQLSPRLRTLVVKA